MKTEKTMTNRFYQNLGKLFYAVAAADKAVKPAEINKLRDIVKTEWLEVDALEDEFHTDAAYQIEIVFDYLNTEAPLDSELCYTAFMDYRKEQAHLFTEDITQLILKTARAIASAFSGLNKSELIMLAKLEKALKNK
ncbi:hypothetical protein [Formosa sp. S-31]|uniref:hypothetical protein n=1 Tax=Formosa sp. S-31 TaxID=2790949 RepID=UPI003EC11D95